MVVLNLVISVQGLLTLDQLVITFSDWRRAELIDVLSGFTFRYDSTLCLVLSFV